MSDEQPSFQGPSVQILHSSDHNGPRGPFIAGIKGQDHETHYAQTLRKVRTRLATSVSPGATSLTLEDQAGRRDALSQEQLGTSCESLDVSQYIADHPTGFKQVCYDTTFG